MRANHENLAKARHLPPKRKYEYARKVKEDIQIVADIFRDKFGRTWEELKTPKAFSQLQAADVKRERVGHARMWKAAENKLPEWVATQVESGRLYAMEEGDDGDNVNDSEEEADVDPLTPRHDPAYSHRTAMMLPTRLMQSKPQVFGLKLTPYIPSVHGMVCDVAPMSVSRGVGGGGGGRLDSRRD